MAQGEPPRQKDPQSYNVVIVAGGTNASAVEGGDLPRARYWVALAGAGDDGTPTTITPEACAGTGVRFSLDVPKEAGLVAPSAVSRGVAVDAATLASPGWSAADAGVVSLDAAHRVEGTPERSPLYCVAYTTALRLADTGVEQALTARIEGGDPPSPMTPSELRIASDAGAGAVYEFEGVRRDRRSSRFVIVDQSIPRPYGFAGSQVPVGDGGFGTYAVVLGAWDGSAVSAPTAAQCRGASVAFSLQPSGSAGLGSATTEVRAVWVDSSRARALFPDRMKDYEAGEGPLVAAARTGDDAGGATPPFLCVAEAPLSLTPEVGFQRVTARVKQSGTAPALSLVEDLRRPRDPSGAATGPGAEAAFHPVRVHARPRAIFGLMMTVDGDVWREPETRAVTTTTTTPTETGSTSETTTEEVETGEVSSAQLATMAGFDFAVQPVLRGLTFGCVQPSIPLRVAVATNVSGDPFDSIYVGFSGSSTFSQTATANPIDYSVGVAFRRESTADYPLIGEVKGKPMLAWSVTIDLRGALSVLKDVIAL